MIIWSFHEINSGISEGIFGSLIDAKGLNFLAFWGIELKRIQKGRVSKPRNEKKRTSPWILAGYSTYRCYRRYSGIISNRCMSPISSITAVSTIIHDSHIKRSFFPSRKTWSTHWWWILHSTKSDMDRLGKLWVGRHEEWRVTSWQTMENCCL